MKNTNRPRTLILTLALCTVMLLILVGCGGSDPIIGKWYDKDGDCVTVKSNGTFIDYENDSGTWEKIDDNLYRFKYDDDEWDILTENRKIEKDEFGQYLDFGMFSTAKYYKGHYPTENEQQAVKEANAVTIDPFDGISFDVTGISPRCVITENTQNCCEAVQNGYVTYSYDKECYSNGETAVITAVLSDNTGDTYYKLSQNSMTYEVKSATEYVTDINKVNTDSLVKEFNDFFESRLFASENGNTLFDAPSVYMSGERIKTIDKTSAADTYFSVLKPIRYVEADLYFNILSFPYAVTYTNGFGERHSFYVCVNAYNLVLDSKGNLKWGSLNIDDYDFIGIAYEDGSSIDDCISACIMVNKDNYNISKSSIEVVEMLADRPIFDSCTATSFYNKDKYNKCKIEDAFDNDSTTCWQDGVDGYGEGEMLTATSIDSQTVSCVIIRNGFPGNSSLYNQNSRVKDFTVIYDGGEESFTLEDTAEPQTFQLSTPVETKFISIRIDSVYNGSKYKDTCITDIIFA